VLEGLGAMCWVRCAEGDMLRAMCGGDVLAVR
jgi:hypothetical protein